MGKLKRSIKQRSRIEGSICQGYIARETSHFASYYFGCHVMSARTRIDRHDDGGVDPNVELTFKIFNRPERPSGECKERWLTTDEYKSAHMHILINCDEIADYVTAFQQEHNIDPGDLGHPLMSEIFPQWFEIRMREPNGTRSSYHMRDLSLGPMRQVRVWKKCTVNGFYFQVHGESRNRKTENSGVFVKGADGENDWYGIIKEILELEYPGEPLKTVILFMCEWFDPTPSTGWRKNKSMDVIEVRRTRRYRMYDPFVLGQKTSQVYYVHYPPRRGSLKEWSVAIKVRPQGRVIIDDTLDVAYQDSATYTGLLGQSNTLQSRAHPSGFTEEVGEEDEINVTEDDDGH